MINWSRINERLPYAKTPEQFEKRKRMWKAIDVNDNGFVSLAEVTRVRQIIDSRNQVLGETICRE